ncbi:hypothetical protein [Hyella patelloides]|uniref:hypothetical protein n=1 Tax=Hyella patelloides TaxID=1982969 RepID=UPI0011A744FD|nr:hypothetical protein [Hyella patelloides]
MKPPQLWFVGSQKAIADVALIEKQDCQKFIDTIYITENQIHRLENHRYIEESASLFTIKLEYQKGANKLTSVAKQYLDLDVAENSQHYSQQLAQMLQEKAQLFKKRSETVENGKGVKQIFNLLEQMDLVTKQRQNLITAIEKQCNF